MKTKKLSIIVSMIFLTTTLNAVEHVDTSMIDSPPSTTTKKDNSFGFTLNNYQLAFNKAEIEIDLNDDDSYLVQAILFAIKKNLIALKSQGIIGIKAEQINIDFILKALTPLNIENFDNDVSQECKEDEKCINATINSLESTLLLDEKKVYEIIQKDIVKKDIPAINIEKFSCQSGEIKTIQHYGVKDLFSTANGLEPAHPYPATALHPPFVNSNILHNATYANYDNSTLNRQFLENIHNYPTAITSGRFYISLKSNGGGLQSNDGLAIGEVVNSNNHYYSQHSGSSFFSDLLLDGWSQSVTANNPAIHTYWNDFSNITFNNGTTLLQYVGNTNHFDVYIQDDTSVDYITIVTCSPKPDPIKEIKEVVNKFKCSRDENLVQILGGTIDAFSPTADTPAHPSAQLMSFVTFPITSYDATFYDRHFLETLQLPNMVNITKAELNIGYRRLNSELFFNDELFVGDYGTNHAHGFFYFGSNPIYNANNIVTKGWSVHTISNGETIAQANLANVNNTTGTGNVFATALSTGYIDIYVEDDTSIDFAQLNLCTKKRRIIINTPGDYIGVTAKKESNTSVRISFKDNSDNEDGFKIFGFGIEEDIPSNDETKHTYVYKTITGLTCNKMYSIQALAYKGEYLSLPTSVRTFNIHTTFGISCDK